MYLKDYHRKNLLAGAEEDETPKALRTYAEEEQALKDAFHTSLPTSDNEQDDLIKPKPKNKSSKETEEQEYQSFLSKSLQDPSSQKLLQQLQSLASTTTTTSATTLETEDGEAFLAKYLLSRGWLETPATTTEQPELYEDNSSDEEKVETFETKYNFRFEAPGAGEVTTHARTLATTRRGDEKRKRERERKRTAKEEEKRKEMEEIARLRNLKRMEIEERIRRVEGVAGAGGWTEKDLEGDFDPDEWDTRMQGVFNETYYNEVCVSPFEWVLMSRRIRRNRSSMILIFRIWCRRKWRNLKKNLRLWRKSRQNERN
jgi:protein KRI1